MLFYEYNQKIPQSQITDQPEEQTPEHRQRHTNYSKNTTKSMCQLQELILKARKKAKIKNQYNQEPHLTLDIVWESDKNLRKHCIKEREASASPAGDHKTARNRQDSITKVSNGAKIRNRYNQVPHLTQDTNRKVTNSQKTPQTRAKRSALSQQVTTKHI